MTTFNVQGQLIALQSEIVDHQVPVSSLLQKSVLLAFRCNDQVFGEWAKRELNGYKGDEPRAEHRILKGEYVILTPEGRQLPIAWDDPSEMRSRFVSGPIAELESLFSGNGATFCIMVNVDPRTMKFNDPVEPGSKVAFVVVRATVAAFFSAIRQMLLAWTINHLSLDAHSTTPSSDSRHTLVEGDELPNARDSRNVFVVHGRNLAARDAIFALLRAVDLNPLEWEAMVHATGKGSPYVGEVLKKGFEIAQATVVLMTPDDEARLAEGLRREDDPPHEKTLMPQPRPNVLVEVGMALGMNEDRTVVVEFGRLRPISDLLGRYAIRMDGSAESRQKLIKRLKAAGCNVKDDGTDWLSVGNFDAADSSTHSTIVITGQKARLFASDGVLWSVDDHFGENVLRPHCPQCHAPLNRVIDFVDCPSCSFKEFLPNREPSNLPSDHS